jgi:hypothetical protein
VNGRRTHRHCDPGCTVIAWPLLLTAEKRDDLWLKTGDHPFCTGPNGTAPEVRRKSAANE